MKAPFRLIFSILALGSACASAQAQITAFFDFDGLPSGSLASGFHTPEISFHQAYYTPSYDAWGDPIDGSEHWAIDTESDLLWPLTVEDPLNYDRGPAPSGATALQALWQPVYVAFDGNYFLDEFQVTLDNDTYGMMEQISFLSGNAIVAQIALDQSQPGITAMAGGISNVTGMILPAGAFYDNLQLTVVPVPEPATYGVLGTVLLAFATIRRVRRKR